MEFNHNNVRRRVVEEDRLSSLPDELIYKIMSSFDMKFVVQTCLLSSKWKLVWTSMPWLNFSSGYFGTLPKFARFVKNVLSHRNHQVEVSSVKLQFHGALNQFFVKNIANYAFSHNVQELAVVSWSSSSSRRFYPPCLFSSQSLKHFTLTCNSMELCDANINKTRLDFPALTTFNLSDVELRGDVFCKCVNLKNLTLQHFRFEGPEEVFDIITPCLSNLILTNGRCSETINLIAPQLENLTIVHCSITYLNAPPGLQSLCYTSDVCYDGLVHFSNERFHSLNKVTLSLSMFKRHNAYKEKDARKIINLLQELHSARYVTLNADTVECLSSFPDLLSHQPSPFSNLICLTIDSSMWKVGYKLKMSTEARNFLLDNSPNASLTMKLPTCGINDYERFKVEDDGWNSFSD